MLQTLCCYAFSFAILLALWISTCSFMKNVVLLMVYYGSAGYLCTLLAGILDRLLPRRKVSSSNKAVFITGCDTGFGHLIAKRLDSKGYKVFAGCLAPSGPGAEKLKRETSRKLTVIDIDVTSDESVQNALKSVEEGLLNAKLWAVVNNAGIIIRGETEWTPIEDYKKVLDVNTLGVVRVTQAFLPLLRKFKGRVVTTTSFGGRFSFSSEVPYCMSKFAANAFCDGLRFEMEKWGVKVITVEPFAFRTPMTDLQYTAECVERTWAKAPDHVKESYGTQYVNESVKANVKFHETATSDRVSQVIDCLEEAVSAYSPHYTYTPGTIKSIVGFWILRRLPLKLTNGIIARIVTYDDDIAKWMKSKFKEMESDRKKS